MTFSKLNNTLIFKVLLANLLMLAIITTTAAQVQFKLSLLEDGETYQVSLIPEKSWAHPYNITSTGQVTIKAPTNSFEVTELTSLQLGIEWQDNSRSDAPNEAPGTDYISFGLATLGTVDFAYEAGVEMPLFTFKNRLPCQGEVALMNNEEDPFMAPNSRRANVGNSITIFGARGEAYSGNATDFTVIPCQSTLSTNIEETKVMSEAPTVYPNPAMEEVFVEMNWINGHTEGDLIIMDVAGKVFKKQAVSLDNGANKIQIEVADFPFGIYSIEVQFDGQSLPIDRFVKGNR